jgi:DNA-binding NarL/FixJ family response regulator
LEAGMIRVVVVDDEVLVRGGFQLILNLAPDIDVVATADGPRALDVIALHHPDVVLLDIRMPGKDGLSILHELRAAPERPVVAMLTTFDSDEYIATALRNGAAGFLLKDTDPEQLPQLVRTLHGGGVVLSPTVSSTVVDRYLSAGADQAGRDLVGLLTHREREVLVLLADGLSNAEIGGRLFLSVGTVKDHVSAILAKFDVGTRVQASLLAQRAGLLHDTERPAR